jgi:hypothetical protein
MDFNKVSRLMNHYSNSPSHYIRRLKKKNSRTFRYKINPKGVKYLTEYVKRVKLGINLNLRPQARISYMSTYIGHKSVRIRSLNDMVLTSEQLAPYIRINKRGEHELGVTEENKLKIVGLIRDEEKDKEALDESQSLDEKKRKGKVTGKVKKAAKVHGESSEVYVTYPEPQVQKMKTSIVKPEKPLKSPVKKESKERINGSNKYIVLDLTEDELQYPEKVHRGQTGRSATSQQIAENCVYGLNELDKQMRKTLDKNNLKILQDKRRKLLLFLRYNSDVAQFVDVRQD